MDVPFSQTGEWPDITVCPVLSPRPVLLWWPQPAKGSLTGLEGPWPAPCLPGRPPVPLAGRQSPGQSPVPLSPCKADENSHIKLIKYDENFHVKLIKYDENSHVKLIKYDENSHVKLIKYDE